MRHIWSIIALMSALFLAAMTPAFGQGLDDAMDDPFASAADAVVDMAESKLLIRDLLDTEIMGADGDSLGTVSDFVVLPGGNLVAVTVDLSDGGRIALPFELVKIQEGAITATETAADLTGSQRLQDLAQTLLELGDVGRDLHLDVRDQRAVRGEQGQRGPTRHAP